MHRCNESKEPTVSECDRMEKEEKPWLDGAIQAKDPSKPLLNFSPGPAPLPSVVLKRIRDELMNYEKVFIRSLLTSFDTQKIISLTTVYRQERV